MTTPFVDPARLRGSFPLSDDSACLGAMRAVLAPLHFYSSAEELSFFAEPMTYPRETRLLEAEPHTAGAY